MSPATTISILTPVFRHDPTPIGQNFSSASDEARARLEWVILDDGSGDPSLTKKLKALASSGSHKVRLIVLPSNGGRAAARNRLIAEAQGRHVLFLDADMIPDQPAFLDRWLALIDADDPPVAFGGFSVVQAKSLKATALHKFMSARSDCRSAADRALDPAQFTATSNLLVRRDVLAETPFDEAFVGWGWEDVDWALRASRFGAIRHLDNTATHAGLDSVETLLRKFREAGPNYGRLATKHPEAVSRFASWRAAQALKRVPVHRAARPALSFLARDPWGCTPMLARHAALKLYRTSIYAEHAP
jgi:glycosyltransferase involved in cell wall biosynthesis